MERGLNEVIRPFSRGDFPQIVLIADEGLGKGYVKSDDMNARNTWVMIRDDMIIGFCKSPVYSAEEFIHEISSQSKLPDEVTSAKRILFFKTVAIHENYRMNGLALRFVRDVYRQNRNVSVAGLKWQRKGKEIRHSLTEQLGTKLVAVLPEYWKGESEKIRFTCPECGDPPCLCPAYLYFKV